VFRACYVHSISISHVTYHNLIKTSELQCLEPVNQKSINHQYLSHSPVQSINQSINQSTQYKKLPTSPSGPSPRSKWRIGETPGHPKAAKMAPKIRYNVFMSTRWNVVRFVWTTVFRLHKTNRAARRWKPPPKKRVTCLCVTWQNTPRFVEYRISSDKRPGAF